MIKRSSFLTVIIFHLVGISVLSAQTAHTGQLLSADTIVVHKVMIIPFKPDNYFSDADVELAQKNEKNVTDLSTLFRYGLNYNISAHVISSYGAYNILNDTTVQSQEDLRLIYSSVTYRYEKPLGVDPDDTSSDHTIHQKDLFGRGEEEQPAEEEKKITLKKDKVESTGAEKYLNAVVTKPEIFSTLHDQYGADLFLFVNQFELVTNYMHCLDRTKNYFERKVVVHYSIYNVDGIQLKGDAVTVTFSSSETDIDAIIGQQFPIIADYLSQSLYNSADQP